MTRGNQREKNGEKNVKKQSSTKTKQKDVIPAAKRQDRDANAVREKQKKVLEKIAKPEKK